MEADSGDMKDLGPRRDGGRASGAWERVALAGMFVDAAARYWLTVFPRVRRELRRRRARAREVPEPGLREVALAALQKRGNIEGAAAFAAFVPWRRRRAAVRALVAFQATYNYIDMLAEQPCADPVANGRRLHEALLIALDPAAAHLDYYEHYPRREDGGYLRELVDTCRATLAALPSYAAVAAQVRTATVSIVAFQSLSLGRGPGARDALVRWARAETPPGTGLEWWETASARGTSLGVHALIATAAERGVRPAFVVSIASAYLTWAGSLHSLLDSLVDEAEDADSAQFSFIGCYVSPQEASVRMGWLAARSARALRELPRGRRHLILLAGMTASYLSLPEASAPRVREATESVIANVGPPVGAALLVFRARRLLGRCLPQALGRVRAAKPAAAPGAHDAPSAAMSGAHGAAMSGAQSAPSAAMSGAHGAVTKTISLSVIAVPPGRACQAPAGSRKGGADAGAA
jgi:tetraprenyl-beta-curcumene synthase